MTAVRSDLSNSQREASLDLAQTPACSRSGRGACSSAAGGEIGVHSARRSVDLWRFAR